MCGIAGYITTRPQRRGQTLIRTMLRVLEARGPEGTSWLAKLSSGDVVWNTSETANIGDDPCTMAFGCARLAINDVSSRGLQPIANSNQSVWVALNGEIYNFVELRRTLTAMGYSFRSGTDTEVIAHAYTAWGNKCFDHFNGQFAIAIADMTHQTLTLARDRIGITPLFLRRTPHAISFASELRGILAGPGEPPEINPERLAATIGFPYKLHQRQAATLYKDVIHVLPGERITIDMGLTVKRQFYWRADRVTAPIPSNLHDACEHLQTLYIDAVRKRLRTDRRFAFIVSGGIDSPSVIGIAQKLFDADIKTFSLDLPDERFNENDSIRQVIMFNNVKSQFISVTADIVAKTIPRVFARTDEPLPTPNALLHTILADAIGAEGFRVVLNGVGGDEVFCGYHDHFLYHLRDLQRNQPEQFEDEFASWQKLQRRPPKTYEDFKAFGGSPTRVHSPDFLARSRGYDYLQCLRPDFRDASLSEDAMFEIGDMTLRDKQIADLTRLTLPHALKMDDRCYMGQAIESRQPLLDHELIELGLSLPHRYKIRRGVSKFLLRKAVRPFVPPSRRRDIRKVGLNLPIDKWMAGPLKPWVLDHLGDSSNPLFHYCDHDAVKNVLTEHFDGIANHSLKIWDLVSTNNWLEQNRNLAKVA